MPVDEESHEALLQDEKLPVTRDRKPSAFLLCLPWALNVLFIGTTLFFALRKFPPPPECLPTECPSLFPTDFVAGLPELKPQMIQKRFTNDLRLNISSQKLYNEPLDPNEILYIGEPSKAIDQAWDDLLKGQYVALTPEEAAQFPTESQIEIEYNGKHNFFELSVFHNLHCLDAIRMALDPRPDNGHMHGGIWDGRAHIDHCVDQIRQAIECHGDMTPVPLLPIVGGPSGLIIGNGGVHMCKDFEAIKEWVRYRSTVMRPLGE